MNDAVFFYDRFELSPDRKEVALHYTSQHAGESHSFVERYRFPASIPDTFEAYRLLKALHIAAGISYYKLFLQPEIEHPYALSSHEAEFWNEVFTSGLGEFLYVNQLPAEIVARFDAQEGEDAHTSNRINLSQKALLGIGGGKDSIVAGELLKQIGVSIEGFVMATGTATGQTTDVAKTMKVKLHAIEREFDQRLIDLQQRPNAYKGHIPISVLFALTGSLLALTQQASYIVVANESSASIPRVQWGDIAVNHQWSKSFTFEQRFQLYLHEYVSLGLYYFSAIRPLSSIAVAKLFSRYPQYFEVFTSDNYALRIRADQRPADRWSLESAKSLSSFILMSAWLNEDELLKIFGRNFYNEASLGTMLWRLLGVQDTPPLDCVGTPEELMASMLEARRRGIFGESALMKAALQYNVLKPDAQSHIEQFLRLSPEHAIPPELQSTLLTTITKEVL